MTSGRFQKVIVIGQPWNRQKLFKLTLHNHRAFSFNTTKFVGCFTSVYPSIGGGCVSDDQSGYLLSVLNGVFSSRSHLNMNIFILCSASVEHEFYDHRILRPSVICLRHPHSFCEREPPSPMSSLGAKRSANFICCSILLMEITLCPAIQSLIHDTKSTVAGHALMVHYVLSSMCNNHTDMTAQTWRFYELENTQVR